MFCTNIISRTFGKFASKKFPKKIQNLINTKYVNAFQLDMSEFREANEYESLNALFTRGMLKLREFTSGKNEFMSPCDALISEAGDIRENIALQIKGKSYKIESLLEGYDVSTFKNSKFINFYLSPKDYHRYHTPIDMQIISSTYIPGKLYPVNFKYLKKINSLFSQNERVVLECMSDGKRFFMVFVGALNVGNMVFHFDTEILTNASKKFSKKEYEDVHLKKADELGYFKMGSTIVMVFEKDFINLDVEVLKDVKFTDKIATKV